MGGFVQSPGGGTGVITGYFGVCDSVGCCLLWLGRDARSFLASSCTSHLGHGCAIEHYPTGPMIRSEAGLSLGSGLESWPLSFNGILGWQH